ncbi:MAG: DUF3551 domain-containing protein [Pseudorhodoplanes sp.]
MKTTMLAGLLAIAGLFLPGAAQAQTYPWCADFQARGGEITNCGFMSRRQCMEAISGVGGYCRINGAYQERVRAEKKPPRRMRRN